MGLAIFLALHASFRAQAWQRRCSGRIRMWGWVNTYWIIGLGMNIQKTPAHFGVNGKVQGVNWATALHGNRAASKISDSKLRITCLTCSNRVYTNKISGVAWLLSLGACCFKLILVRVPHVRSFWRDHQCLMRWRLCGKLTTHVQLGSQSDINTVNICIYILYV